ncbi:hypothetical protein [Streptomyces sp. 8N616]|uniref:hypothetical protein n=1 Tax=Streptomyces sp. 8N616 TaxID=3457414 RepID=UPI003FD24225
MTQSTPGDGAMTRRTRHRRAALASAVAAAALVAAGLIGFQAWGEEQVAAGSASAVTDKDRRADDWQRTPVPVEKGDLTAVAALDERQAWAVGYRLKSDTEVEALALRWDGESWTQESTLPNGNFPQALAVRSAEDIWVAGTGSSHWDGEKWTDRALARDPAGRVMSDAITVSGDDGVWTAGRAVPGSIKDSVPAIQSWDGDSWQRQDLPDVGKGELSGIVALAEDDVWAVGAAYAADADSPQTPLVLHWDGTSWKKSDAPGADGKTTWLGGVTALAPDDIWAVGGSASADSDRPYALHWDGKTWKSAPTPDVADGRLRTVGRAGDGSLWATGGKGAVSVALRWNSEEKRWDEAAAPEVVVRSTTTVPGSNALWTAGIARRGDLVPEIVRFTG